VLQNAVYRRKVAWLLCKLILCTKLWTKKWPNQVLSTGIYIEFILVQEIQRI
jgi:hypothetical protein